MLPLVVGKELVVLLIFGERRLFIIDIGNGIL